MAYTVTRGDILQRARDLGEISTSFNAMLRRWFDVAYAELYNLLIETNGDYFINPQPYYINLVADQQTYDLPANFYKLKSCAILNEQSEYMNLPRVPFAEMDRDSSVSSLSQVYGYGLFGEKIWIAPPPDAASTNGLRLYYIKAPQKFTSDNDIIDGIAGFEEYIVADLCMKNAYREESEAGQWTAMKDRVEARIRGSAVRDKSGPPQWRLRSYERHRGWPLGGTD